jgi:hypothetical protein
MECCVTEIKCSELPERQFQSGAVRDSDNGKGRYDLLCPYAIDQLAKHMQNGCNRYGDRNWEKGISQSVFFDSAMRHLNKFARGMDDENHLLAAFWNLHGMVSQRERMKAGLLTTELDDFPTYGDFGDPAVSLLDRIDRCSGITGMTLGAYEPKPPVVVLDSELLHRSVEACLNACDDIHGEQGRCNKDFSCGDKGCADHLIAKVNSSDLS